jgi:hypothetical protein
MSGVAVLDAPDLRAEDASEAPVRATYPRTCPECGTAFGAAQRGQLFCSTSHKRAYNNRWLKRGAVLAPIAAAARATRDGTRGDRNTGRQASIDANRLLQMYQEEDARAGRLSVVDYMAARYRLGLVEIFR